MGLAKQYRSLEPYLRSILRIVAGLNFLTHGVQKSLGLLGGMGGAPSPLDSLMGVAGVIETIGAPLLILGLFTRPVAFILAGQMAVAYFHTHLPRDWFPLLNGGEITVTYCFLFLWLAAAGPGPWSLDRLYRKVTS